MNTNTETLRLNISDYDALKIKEDKNREGCRVDIFRYSKDLIEIKIHYPNRVIEVNPKRLY